MAPKKTNSDRKKTSRRGARNAALYLAAFAMLALAAAILVVFGCNRKPSAPTGSTLATSTTLWPHGQPEYQIEVPQGYEDLLPESEAPEAAAPKSSGAAPGAKSAGRPAADSAEKALPYIQTIKARKTREGAAPTLILVIDDAGYNLDQLKPFLALPFPLTVAVLPQVDHSAESAKLAAQAGKEVILHQPMQALGGNDPGPGAIRLGMPADEVSSILRKNLDSLPEAVGVNNHMGSAATRDRTIMASVLDLVKKRGIYYLDSLTAPGTATAALCKSLSIPYWERDVFLDNTGDKQSILHALEEGKKAASARGASVMIGHVWSSELAQTLMDIYPRLVEEGYSLSTISQYMMRSAAGEDDAGSGD